MNSITKLSSLSPSLLLHALLLSLLIMRALQKLPRHINPGKSIYILFSSLYMP